MTALTAILLPVVLLGSGALVLDVGSWYSQQAQTQNGADAGALAVAKTCAGGVCLPLVAAAYAPGNSNGTLNTSAAIRSGFPCGRDTLLKTLPSCSGVDTSICPAAPTGNYVDVLTTTVNKSTGSTVVAPLLGRVLEGSSYQGQTIGSCSQASWGPIGATFGTALTISLCNWTVDTASGLTFAPSPPYLTWPPVGVASYTGLTAGAPGLPGGEQVLQLKGSYTDPCLGAQGASGFQLPGGFGWLDDPNGTCTNYINAQNLYSDKTGVPATSQCKAALQNSVDNHTPIYIPVYDGVTGNGSNGTYHLKGFAVFVVTGGYLNGQGGFFNVASTISKKSYCKGAQRCLYGFFTSALVPNSDGQGSLPGANTVRLAG